MALGFQPGASPANTYSLPLAAEPRTSSDGVGNGARLVHGLAAVGAVGPGGVCASNCAAGTASASSTAPASHAPGRVSFVAIQSSLIATMFFARAYASAAHWAHKAHSASGLDRSAIGRASCREVGVVTERQS